MSQQFYILVLNELKCLNESNKKILEALSKLDGLGNKINDLKTKSKENTDELVAKLEEVSGKLSQLILKFP